MVLDPTCGAGSLLIPAVHQLIDMGLSHQLAEQVAGLELHQEFVIAAQARLALAAATRSTAQNSSHARTPQRFPLIKKGDVLKNGAVLARATHIVLNPPFGMIKVDDSVPWTTGLTNSASFIAWHCMQNMQSGARLIAILPEVLRSGSRYSRWRSQVTHLMSIGQVESLGQFDSKTDVHVFLLQATRRLVNEPMIHTHRDSTWSSRAEEPQGHSVDSKFHVSVGSVIPHRHPEDGERHPYASARTIDDWTEVEIATTRQFAGRCISPPFVVVRRTSRPGERFRARPTIITGDRPVAVENHLIVLSPRKGGIDLCRELVALLARRETTEWLDDNYQCRHLTVGAVKRIPWRDTTTEQI